MMGVQGRPELVAHVRQELRLVLACLGKLPIRLLKLLEEAGVLDGDGGLARERLQEGDLLLGERTLFEAVQRDDANRLAFAQQRCCHLHQEANDLLASPAVWELGVHHREDVRDVDRSLFEHGAASDAGPAHRRRPSARVGNHLHHTGAVHGDGRHDVPFTLLDDASVGAAQHRCPLDDAVQHELQVGRRGGDDPQHFGGRGLLLQRHIAFGSQRSHLSRVCLPERRVLRLKLRDPRQEIVRHPVHPGPTAPLRDGARIARGSERDM